MVSFVPREGRGRSPRSARRKKLVLEKLYERKRKGNLEKIALSHGEGGKRKKTIKKHVRKNST